MLLADNTFDEISNVLRKDSDAQRNRRLQVDVTFATATGELVDARLHHFARAGVVLTSTTPLSPGKRFGFKVAGIGGTHVLFCEVVACRHEEMGFTISASFLAREIRQGDERVTMAN